MELPHNSIDPGSAEATISQEVLVNTVVANALDTGSH